MEIELSQYAGYAGLILANGGLAPNEDSYFFKKYGFKPKITLSDADNWSPLESKIKGLSASCKRGDVDVVLNANTPELAAEQYTSMILERTIVDRVKRAPGFVQMFPSSEITPSLVAPGLAPTWIHKAITHGAIAT